MRSWPQIVILALSFGSKRQVLKIVGDCCGESLDKRNCISCFTKSAWGLGTSNKKLGEAVKEEEAACVASVSPSKA